MTTALSVALMAFRSLMATTLMATTLMATTLMAATLMAALLTTTCLRSPISRNFNYAVVTNSSHCPIC